MIHEIKNKNDFAACLKLSESKLLVIDFTATWCGPCRVIGPVFKVLSEANTDVEFAKVDVDEADEVAASCGIQAMPTFQFYKNGAKVDEMCGANKQELKDLILKLK